MVWENQHGRYSSELYHTGDVPALQRPRMCHYALQDPGEVWPFYLRLFCCRNGHQNHCHGTVWEIYLFGWLLEPIRLFHSDCWVSTILFAFFDTLSISVSSPLLLIVEFYLVIFFPLPSLKISLSYQWSILLFKWLIAKELSPWKSYLLWVSCTKFKVTPP